MNILLIEDNLELASLVSLFLQREGYNVIHAKSGEEGIVQMHDSPISLVLLDIMLPGINGFEVTKEIRKNRDVPIIILSAKSQKDDKLLGLSLGADDYIEKPFDIDILLAKIKALLRRNSSQDDNNTIRSGAIEIDKPLRLVKFKGQELELTMKEYELLLLFVQNEHRILDKEFIFNKVWGMDSFSEFSTLTVHVNRLREKVEENPKMPKRIITVWGVGYLYEKVD